MADNGTTILNLPATVALNDTDVLPLARPSGTTAPGSDLGITGRALKALFPAAAPLSTATNLALGIVRGGGAGNVSMNADGSMTGVSQLWQAGGGAGSPGYKVGQLLHNSAGVDFYYLADITGANATAEPLLLTSTAATNALVHRLADSSVWQSVGDPANGNIFQVPANNAILLGANSDSNTFGVYAFNCSFGANASGNVVGNGPARITAGINHVYNVYGTACANITSGDRVQYCRFGNVVQAVTIGSDCTSITISDNSFSLNIGAGCKRVQLVNCTGTSTTPFVVPAGTVDALYINNARVFPITANQYGTHPAFTSQAGLNAYLLGGTTPPPAAPTVSNASFTAA